ncbi:hypothetical protein BAUCODRAFT_149577 [Baudoinia panamericana UAMH 10762]|uniref:SET domain-containing protein n=1 Tax=Baudoinia panamericana (strain UAMH 10762) TaxID=717646 RepID=M2MSD7_BAUPA|nr:uncharacterized protein BAUCODRAFT_149577 [Baudoinia panamericana UAMH 10762]EMC94418.1 hypothetical protein BAUCODRAFT_149577 [Baudoinia panamericana UAMH 10762]
MGPPTSECFVVQDLPGAGRGVIASKDIPGGTVILDSEGPAAHVIFRQYRKEVCAYCFEYDRGRTRPVRDNEIGKVFCNLRCHTKWLEQQGDLGKDAWRALQTFVQSRNKAVTSLICEQVVGGKPTPNTTRQEWSNADSQVQSRRSGNSSSSFKGGRSNHGQKPQVSVEPDILSFLLSGVLAHHVSPQRWQTEMLDLAPDDQPYTSFKELQMHCTSFQQLASFVPDELQSSCTTEVCHTLASIGSHNAFGIRAGSEDGEEYMGYAIYPDASYFNHSCSPNLLKRRMGRCWAFWTTREIKKGEQCCITYLGGDEKELDVADRRARLKRVWAFDCMCERCKLEVREETVEHSHARAE